MCALDGMCGERFDFLSSLTCSFVIRGDVFLSLKDISDVALR